MAIDRDLFLPILALDSYNRGYNEGTKIGGTQLGTATITRQKVDSGWQALGFYATSYDWQGETVISYRGTDNFSPRSDFTFNGAGASDIFTGWTIALGTGAALAEVPSQREARAQS